jgi:hypothetical protein
LGELSLEGLCRLQVQVEGQIRRLEEAPGNARMNQPENLHGDPPPTQGSHFQSINQVGRFADELHRQQKDVEAIFQTQGQQFASSIPVTPSSLYLQNSRSRGIETLGPRKFSEKSNSMHHCILMCFRTRPSLSNIGKPPSLDSATANLGKQPCTQCFTLRF